MRVSAEAAHDANRFLFFCSFFLSVSPWSTTKQHESVSELSNHWGWRGGTVTGHMAAPGLAAGWLRVRLLSGTKVEYPLSKHPSDA